MDLYRYINNSDFDIVRGEHVVPAYDQVISNVEIPELHIEGILCLLNGITLSSGLEEEMSVMEEPVAIVTDAVPAQEAELIVVPTV